ncbi:ubiquitin-conjugating enzyme/RWD-like protein [Armillaria novae-zelandiae]|uniref:Ubiquitin-conjugating enzyme/RWD-like protein n=1 Tax=Armillaria novae-zelandiae TaxID=153914 RepID=A0AA39TP24_9AGAR|nr:ubiquitin-conjugating enzyme/RWD-like protein [Armillaria novae-zelandiae]
MASISSRRLAKELHEIKTEGCPVGINLLQAEDFAAWQFTIEVMGESLYQGEVFTLLFRFDKHYPISSPAVQFVVTDGKTSPVHPHVYSNGHICASILGNEWSPVLSVIAVCVTLQSMLASCKKKERPPDNDRYVRHAPENPKKTQFHYDDDTV